MTQPAALSEPSLAPLVGEALAQRARAALALVAERLADPLQVAEVAARESNRDPIYGVSTWAPVTLSNGLAGTACFYAEAARRDDAWRPLAHRHITALARLMPSAPSRGLHAGPAAVLAAAQSAAGSAGHYGALRRSLAAWVAADQMARIDDAAARAARGERGVAWVDYDVIHGVSGVLRVLLDALDDEPDDAAVRAAVERSLRHLVGLTAPIDQGGRRVPGWWVPSRYQPMEEDRREYPDGDFNLGLAHGAAGPLAVLAAATRRGLEVDGQPEAIARLADWLVGWTLKDDAGPYWPCRVAWHDEVGVRPQQIFTRSAWCYGAPGVAAALHQAGVALDVEPWRAAALAGLRAIFARERADWHLDGPTVCHGDAGLLHVVAGIARAARDADLLAAAARLVEDVVDAADPAHPFVFAHLVPDAPDGWRSATGYRALDVAGLLEGAAGVGCALLDAIEPVAPETSPRGWDRCLALS